MIAARFRMGRALPRLSFAVGAVTLTVLSGVALPAQEALPKAGPIEALPKASTIVERHVEATGGRKAYEAHTSLRIVGTIAVPSTGMSGTIEAFAARPDKLFVKMNIAGIGESLEGFDGTVAWVTSPMTGPMILRGKELEEKKFDADYYSDLRAGDRYKSMKTLEKTSWEGRPSYKVSFVRHDGSEDIEYYDVVTGFKTGRVVTREMMMMGPVSVTHVASDYRKFGDLMHPTTTKQIAMATQIITTVTSVEYDKVDPEVFELPAAIKALIKQ